MPEPAKIEPKGVPGKGEPKGAPGKGAGLTKKIGPLPAWGWIGLGGVGIWILTSRRGGRSAQLAPAQASGGAFDSGDASFGGGGGRGGSTGSTGAGAGAGGPPLPAPAPVAPPVYTFPYDPPLPGPRFDGGPIRRPPVAAAGGAPAAIKMPYVGQTGAALAAGGVDGFVQVSSDAIRTTGSNTAGNIQTGYINPANVIKGFFDMTTGRLEQNPGPGRIAIYS